MSRSMPLKRGNGKWTALRQSDRVHFADETTPVELDITADALLDARLIAMRGRSRPERVARKLSLSRNIELMHHPFLNRGAAPLLDAQVRSRSEVPFRSLAIEDIVQLHQSHMICHRDVSHCPH